MSEDITIVQPRALEQALGKGLAYLEGHQYPSGQFCCYIAPDPAMQAWCIPDSTVFATGLIGQALLPLLDRPGVRPVVELAAYFLRSQQLRCGTWTYFTKWHRGFSLLPADADDTAVNAHLLKALDIWFPDNLPTLLQHRSREGLFYTWMGFRPFRRQSLAQLRLSLRTLKRPHGFMLRRGFGYHRRDIDGAVNANVLYYLGLNEHTRAIVPFLNDIILQRRETRCDKWYHDPLPIYYFISRNYARGVNGLEPSRAPIIERVLALRDSKQVLPALDTALGLTALLHCGYRGPEVHDAALALLRGQHRTGEWPRHVLYYSGPPRRFCFGSEELTTGFCLEALALYQAAFQGQDDRSGKNFAL